MVFLAVSRTLVGQGLGAKIMNYAKEFLKQKFGVAILVGYGDNRALGFFAKQGFVPSEIEGDPVIQGFICTDYFNCALLQCEFSTSVNHITQEEASLEFVPKQEIYQEKLIARMYDLMGKILEVRF
jgi:predicted N-acetyltransferase YhbS